MCPNHGLCSLACLDTDALLTPFYCVMASTCYAHCPSDVCLILVRYWLPDDLGTQSATPLQVVPWARSIQVACANSQLMGNSDLEERRMGISLVLLRLCKPGGSALSSLQWCPHSQN